MASPNSAGYMAAIAVQRQWSHDPRGTSRVIQAYLPFGSSGDADLPRRASRSHPATRGFLRAGRLIARRRSRLLRSEGTQPGFVARCDGRGAAPGDFSRRQRPSPPLPRLGEGGSGSTRTGGQVSIAAGRHGGRSGSGLTRRPSNPVHGSDRPPRGLGRPARWYLRRRRPRRWSASRKDRV